MNVCSGNGSPAAGVVAHAANAQAVDLFSSSPFECALDSSSAIEASHTMESAAFEDTQCEQEELADLVDFEATHEEVLSRIEHCVTAFLQELSFGRLQSIQTVGKPAAYTIASKPKPRSRTQL